MYLSEIMKLIILNSGLGSRLKNLTKNNPKSLVQLDENQTIFSRAISILSKFNFWNFFLINFKILSKLYIIF